MKNWLIGASALVSLCGSSPAWAQDSANDDMSGMDHFTMDHSTMDPSAMDHSGMNHANMTEAMQSGTHAASFSEGSGTARLPGAEGGMKGLHFMPGDWMIMVHGYVTAQYTKDTGPRGDDKFYSTSMAMLSAETSPEWGRIQLKSMFSLEPLMNAKGYPNLFATGETAGGKALVDRQHPHDLFMELAARIDVDVGPDTTLFLYGGPVGEPALGPGAFMHRGSAEYNPEPPITHHWFDSTHITYGVVTGGMSSRTWQIEASAFRGREPDEERWNIETPALDSWSIRASWNPGPNWSLQASHGHIHEPEALHPGENERRTILSVQYSNGALSTLLAFSAKDREPGNVLTAWLAEANWNIDQHHTLFGRIENVANDELFPDHSDPLHDQTFRISKFQAGYAYRLPLGPFDLALGGSLAAYAKPATLDPYYGRNPVGYTLFTRLSLVR